MFVWDRMKCLQFRYSKSHISIHCTALISIDAISIYFKNELGRGAFISERGAFKREASTSKSHIITSKILSIQTIAHTNVHTKL